MYTNLIKNFFLSKRNTLIYQFINSRGRKYPQVDYSKPNYSQKPGPSGGMTPFAS